MSSFLKKKKNQLSIVVTLCKYDNIYLLTIISTFPIFGGLQSNYRQIKISFFFLLLLWPFVPVVTTQSLGVVLNLPSNFHDLRAKLFLFNNFWQVLTLNSATMYSTSQPQSQ